MKKYIQIILVCCTITVNAQVNVHEAVLYVDANSAASGFPSPAMSANIQEYLNKLLIDKGQKVNVLILSQECPRLEYTVIDGDGYWKGPEYNGNDVWCNTSDPSSKVIQILPGDGLSYNTASYTAYTSGNASNGIWQGLQFQEPWQPYHTKYYCLIYQVLDRIYGGGSPVPSLEDCMDDMTPDLDNSLFPTSLYLGGELFDSQGMQGAMRQAKSTFCTNLLFYAPYLHTRDVDVEELQQHVMENYGSDYVLVVAYPKEKTDGSSIYSDVRVGIGKGLSPPQGNCFPTSRTLSESDEDMLINKLLSGGAQNSLNNVRDGVGYLLDFLLAADQEPVPGGVNGCEYGIGGGNNGNGYLRVNFPEFEFYGPALSMPVENSHVKWYNAIDDQLIDACMEATQMAQSHGANLAYFVASGCGTNNMQFTDSRSDFDLNTPSGAGCAVWMYYDQCSDRLFYDIKLSDGVTSQINPGYGISNPDSLAAIKSAMEDILKNTLEQLSQMTDYENATLSESEYPPNQFLMPGGMGETCGDEDPWNIGLRKPGTFHPLLVPKMLNECFVILCEIVWNQEFPQRAWHPQPTKDCLFDVPGAIVGVIDGSLDQINGATWNLIGMLNLSVEFARANGDSRKAMLKGLANPLNLIIGQYAQTVSCIYSAECHEEKMHCFIRLLVNAFFDIFSGAGLLKAAGSLANVRATVDNKMKMFNDDFGDAYNTWKRDLDEARHREHDSFLGTLSESGQIKMTSQASLSRVWEKVAVGNIPGVSMQQFKDFVERMPAYSNTKFYAAFEEYFSPQGQISDPVKIEAFIEDVNTQPPHGFINVFADNGEKYLGAWSESFKDNLVHLRVNVGFLESVDAFRCEANKVPLAFEGHGCSIAEHGVIRHYTTDYHSELNLALEGIPDHPITNELIEFKNVLNVALAKIPNHEGVIYRGIGSKEGEVVDGWSVDQVVEIKKFTSTSVSKEVADDFRVRGGGKFILTILQGKTGKRIDAISAIPEEFEVLYKTNKHYRVMEIVELGGDPPIKEVFLEEIDD